MMEHSSDQHHLTEREVRLSARLLIADYKSWAVAKAEQRIAEMRAKGQRAGEVAWSRIRDAAQERVSGGLQSS